MVLAAACVPTGIVKSNPRCDASGLRRLKVASACVKGHAIRAVQVAVDRRLQGRSSWLKVARDQSEDKGLKA